MSNIITADYNGTQVFFQDDAYLNATAIAKHFNKSPRRWLELPTTIEYIDLLSKKLNVGKSDILKTTRGVNGGTWLHRRLAVPFARWLNVEFAIWCDEQIEQILIGRNQQQNVSFPKTDTITPEEQRMIQNAVTATHQRTGMSYGEIWSRVKNKFGVAKYEQIKRSDHHSAMIYIASMPIVNQPLLINGRNLEETLSVMVELYGYCLHAYEMQEKLSQHPDLADRIDSKIGGQYLHNLKHPLENAMTKLNVLLEITVKS